MTQTALDRVKIPLRLTWIGLWAERLTHAFWPVWTLCLIGLAGLGFGGLNALSLELAWFALLLFVGALAAAIWHGTRRFARPTRAQAMARLDGALMDRPLAALMDAQALGTDDPASLAVWQAHLARMQARLSDARAQRPDLRLAAVDPYALRYVALLGAVLALTFGSIERITALTPASTATAGPAWEAWATPPAYTGKPTIYLNDQTGDTLTLPVGTRLQTRLYGAVGDLLLDETVSARTAPVAASEPVQDFTITRSGALAITGRGGRSWAVTATPDNPPSIMPDDTLTREADGQFKQEFAAADDYGVTQGSVVIALDLAALDRRYGLVLDPDPIAPVTLDLTLPQSGNRAKLAGALTGNLSQSILSNMPVTLTFSVTDAAGQTGQSAPVRAILPGRRFFDPLAAALIEMRRDLLWSRANAPRAAQILRAITNAPDGFVRNTSAYLRLRMVLRRLGAQTAMMAPALQSEITAELWAIALLLEEGDLASAKERLARAQDRLDQAIRNGASKSEIEDLMADLRQAFDDYTRQLAQQSQQNGDQTAQGGPSVSQDQMQQMLDRLQELMEQGKTAEAAELMQRLREFMDNMQVTQGQGGGGPSDQALQGLDQTLRDQQSLSDDAYRGMQDGQTGQDGQSLAQRQQALRDRLDQLGQDGALPGAGTEYGESGRQSLDDAARAMDDAARALREGDLGGALDAQAQALEALRNGIDDLASAQAEQQQENGGTGNEFGQDDPNGRDPLGRRTGNALRNGSDENLLQDQDVYRRADELLDEIRRRAGESVRPEVERDYLKRLLDLF